mmetsp:Transcript_11139/g.31387  ORF Transcript_11139/g.31387 Transcript_11139/m.31387 type:complete len:182 (+) Transcript_11139:268-813(+)
MGIPNGARGAPSIAPAVGLTTAGTPAALAAAAALLFVLAAAVALPEAEAAGADANRDDAGERRAPALGLPLAVAPEAVPELDTAVDGNDEEGADVVRRGVVLAVACLNVDVVVAAVTGVRVEASGPLAFRMERLALPPVAVIVVAVASLVGTKTASRRSKLPSTPVLGILVLLGTERNGGG